jgi:hypothetical protein
VEYCTITTKLKTAIQTNLFFFNLKNCTVITILKLYSGIRKQSPRGLVALGATFGETIVVILEAVGVTCGGTTGVVLVAVGIKCGGITGVVLEVVGVTCGGTTGVVLIAVGVTCDETTGVALEVKGVICGEPTGVVLELFGAVHEAFDATIGSICVPLKANKHIHFGSKKNIIQKKISYTACRFCS